MRKDQLTKRFVLCFTGIAINSVGIALATKGALGTPPISSVPYVLTFFTPLSMGTWSLIINVIFIALQALILRKNFPLIQLLQFPLAFVFSAVIDLALWLMGDFAPSTYPLQLLTFVSAIVVLGFGISVEVLSDTLVVPGEGIIKAIAGVVKRPFGNVKLIFDVSLILLALVISLLQSGSVMGVREGTVLAAICIGPLTRLIMPRLQRRFAVFRCPEEPKTED